MQAALWLQSLERLDLSRKRLHELHSMGNVSAHRTSGCCYPMLTFEGWIDSLRYVCIYIYMYVCCFLLDKEIRAASHPFHD